LALFDEITDSAVLVPYSCNSRLCKTCNHRRSLALSARCLDHLRLNCHGLGEQPNILWLTLTIRNPPFGGLESAIVDLLFAFRELRRGATHRQTSLWDKSVRGYFWNFEVTMNERSRSWHPHIHVLMDADYMRQADLNATYSDILHRRGRVGKLMLGAAYVTDPSGKRVKPGPGGWDEFAIEAAVLEVTKYNLKPFESSRTSASEIFELTRALHNKRLFGSGGDWTLPGVSKDMCHFSAPRGLGALLSECDDPLAVLMDHSGPIARAHTHACLDPVIAAGLARTYGASATAQHFARILADAPPPTSLGAVCD